MSRFVNFVMQWDFEKILHYSCDIGQSVAMELSFLEQFSNDIITKFRFKVIRKACLAKREYFARKSLVIIGVQIF